MHHVWVVLKEYSSLSLKIKVIKKSHRIRAFSSNVNVTLKISQLSNKILWNINLSITLLSFFLTLKFTSVNYYKTANSFSKCQKPRSLILWWLDLSFLHLWEVKETNGIQVSEPKCWDHVSKGSETIISSDCHKNLQLRCHISEFDPIKIM